MSADNEGAVATLAKAAVESITPRGGAKGEAAKTMGTMVICTVLATVWINEKLGKLDKLDDLQRTVALVEAKTNALESGQRELATSIDRAGYVSGAELARYIEVLRQLNPEMKLPSYR